jgi:short-subunit dehydrogenase
MSNFVELIYNMNIVITGASKGLGKAFARAFASEHNTLLLCARNVNNLEVLANELKDSGATVCFQSVDISKKDAVMAFGEWCLTYGTPDILINNAGSFEPGSVNNEADGVIEKMIETNLYSAYHLTRSLLPPMIQKKQGHIFNICSIASIQAYSNGGSYSISKFAMLGFSKNLREEMKHHHIKVTSVLPGAVYTDSWKGSGIDENRIMQDDDIAKMVLAASQLSPQACVEEIVLRPQLGDL